MVDNSLKTKFSENVQHVIVRKTTALDVVQKATTICFKSQHLIILRREYFMRIVLDGCHFDIPMQRCCKVPRI